MLKGKYYDKYMFYIIILLFGINSQVSFSRPLDLRAVELLKEFDGFWEQPISQRNLSNAQIEKCIEMAEYNSSDLKRCSAIVLAFAKDSNSLEILNKLSLDDNVSVKGAASYALKLRHIAERSEEEILRNLCFYLGKSDNQTEKILIANRMWVDYKEKAILTLLDASRLEPKDSNNYFRCDLFYYLSQSDDSEILKEALKLEWEEEKLSTLPESLAYIMGSITPGRPKDDMRNSAMIIEKNIRAKLERNN